MLLFSIFAMLIIPAALAEYFVLDAIQAEEPGFDPHSQDGDFQAS